MGAHNDTIAAIATPPGKGGIGVIRISGPAVPGIARTLCGDVPEPRKATLQLVRDDQQEPIDHVVVLYFSEPNSFTGEHVLEMQGHGGPFVLDALLQRVLGLGARLARPGEYSERAFLNDKIDLTQAEAIADLIEAGSAIAAQAAMRSLRGEFSSRVHDLLQQLIQSRVYVEAALDFPEEEIDFLSNPDVMEGLAGLENSFKELVSTAKQGCLLRDGATIVIAGQPNTGKSSLLNALTGRDRAIVTDIPGTTRDVLHEDIVIDGVPVRFIDTAGLRDAADVIEREGVRRAHEVIATADHVLLIVDDSLGLQAFDEEFLASLPAQTRCTLIYNKIDLTKRTPGIMEGGKGIAISALGGDGISVLCSSISDSLGNTHEARGEFTARRRHLDALKKGQQHVHAGIAVLQQHSAGELLADELRQAQRTLDEITGEFSSDDLLGEIFGSFCIGK